MILSFGSPWILKQGMERTLLKLGTGNGELGTEVWERVYSGNPRENSTWRTKEKKREQFGEMWGSVTVVNVSFYRLCHQIMAQYVLVRAESDWYWDKQSMKWRLGWKSNRYYPVLSQATSANRSGHSLSYIEFQAFIVYSYLLTLCASCHVSRSFSRDVITF